MRHLLWALAHADQQTPQLDALIGDLGSHFRGWDERDAADLRHAASRVWAVCGR